MTDAAGGPTGPGDQIGAVPPAEALLPPTREELDRRTVRRALRAGRRTALVVAVLGVLANAAFGGSGVTAGIWVTSAVVVGMLVSSGWLVLAVILDLVAGVVPGRRRMLWTAGVFALAFGSPVLPAAMLQVAAEAAP